MGETNSAGRELSPLLRQNKIITTVDPGIAIPTKQANAEAGLERVFMELRAELLRFLRARRVGAEEAEDLLQDMFVKLTRRPAGPIGEPRAYLYRMLDNLVLDNRRRDSRRLARDRLWMDLVRTVGDADPAPSLERELAARERLRLVSDRLGALPERTLAVFRSFRIDGCPQREIADELGISLSAVEKHLQRAYRALVEIESTIDADRLPPRRL